MKPRVIVIGIAALALAGLAWRFIGHTDARSVSGENASSSSESASGRGVPGEGAKGSNALADGGRALPRAVHDPAKREEMRKRLLIALAEAQREAEEEKAHPSPDPNARGNREPNDLKELGKFVSQAIKEDFMPMAKACAKDLASRTPDAGGSLRVAFKLLGDKNIGGVVDESHIDGDKSSLHDEKFETCMRESMYGVYFDPPPFGGEATLNFDVNVKPDGSIDDEDVPDFQNIKDRRNEKP